MKLSDLLKDATKKLGGEFDTNRKTIEDMIANPSQYTKEQLADIADIYFQTTLVIREMLQDCIQPAEEMENQINYNKAAADTLHRL